MLRASSLYDERETELMRQRSVSSSHRQSLKQPEHRLVSVQRGPVDF
jgi:hypothetical protein